MRGRTTIIIAHRLSTLRHCNQVLELKNARLVDASHAMGEDVHTVGDDGESAAQTLGATR